jgi:hypothetical protein
VCVLYSVCQLELISVLSSNRPWLPRPGITVVTSPTSYTDTKEHTHQAGNTHRTATTGNSPYSTLPTTRCSNAGKPVHYLLIGSPSTPSKTHPRSSWCTLQEESGSESGWRCSPVVRRRSIYQSQGFSHQGDGVWPGWRGGLRNSLCWDSLW